MELMVCNFHMQIDHDEVFVREKIMFDTLQKLDTPLRLYKEIRNKTKLQKVLIGALDEYNVGEQQQDDPGLLRGRSRTHSPHHARAAPATRKHHAHWRGRLEQAVTYAAFFLHAGYPMPPDRDHQELRVKAVQELHEGADVRERLIGQALLLHNDGHADNQRKLPRRHQQPAQHGQDPNLMVPRRQEHDRQKRPHRNHRDEEDRLHRVHQPDLRQSHQR